MAQSATILDFQRLKPVFSRGSLNSYDKTTVYDPLVLLELSEMRCGHVARIAIDLFKAGGYQGRVVQAGSHVLAEIAYDNSYHYFEANLFGAGKVVINNGKIPSMVELKNNPNLLDALPSSYEFAVIKRLPFKSVPYPSYFYFNKKAYTTKPFYYEKIATPEETENHWYGWNYYSTILDSQERLIDNKAIYYVPGGISYENIKLDYLPNNSNSLLNLQWTESPDLDNDLLGYKVYVSEKSRGWNNIYWQGEKTMEKFNHDLGGWKPQMYDFLFQEPPHDVLLLKTRETKATLELPKGKDYYITIMPYDQHGDSVGRVLYPPSNEVKVSL